MDSSLKTHLANNIASKFSVTQYLRCLLVILSVSQTLPLSNSYVSHRHLWQSTVQHKIGGVYVPIHVGNVKQYVILDTGSTMFWIQCHPCDPCVHQNTPYYNEDPRTILPWTDYHCPKEKPFFDDDGLCAYRVSYADGTTTQGKLAWEALRTSTSNLVFGCSNNTTPNSAFGKSAIITGVLGMGRGKGSFLSQNRALCNGRFSFCFESDTVESQMGYIWVGPHSRVLRGAQELEMIEGRVEDTRYYDVPLESMSYWGSFGWEEINVDRGTFDGGCVLDTGTGMTRLVADAYDALVAVMDDYFKYQGFRKHFRNRKFEEVCYEPTPTVNLQYVEPPKVLLRFKGISDPIYMKWEERQLFDSDRFGGRCLQILPSFDTYTVIGAYQMTHSYFAFDLVKKRIYYLPLPHCKIL